MHVACTAVCTGTKKQHRTFFFFKNSQRLSGLRVLESHNVLDVPRLGEEVEWLDVHHLVPVCDDLLRISCLSVETNSETNEWGGCTAKNKEEKHRRFKNAACGQRRNYLYMRNERGILSRR